MSNCLVTILNCSRASDLKRLKHFQKIEKEQKSKFVAFLTLNEYGCKQKDSLYFIAVKPATLNEPQQLCGVAQTELSQINTVFVNFLTSRAATDPNYKGVGTMILNEIVNYYKDDPRILGIQLGAVSSAISFYLKYGFKEGRDRGDMFYPFDRYYKVEHYDPNMRKSHIRLAVIKRDRDVIDEILYSYNIKLKDIVQTNAHNKKDDKKFLYLNKFLIENYFNQLGIDGYDFSSFIQQEKYELAIALLNRNPKFINYIDDDDIIKIMKDIRGRDLTEFIISLSDAGYEFNETLFKILVNIKNVSAKAVKAMYGNGFKIRDRDFIDEMEQEYEIAKYRYEMLSAVIDILKINSKR